MNVVRLLVVDDEARVREGLRMRLAGEPDLAVVGEAADVATAIAQSHTLHPDVIVLDLALGHADAVPAIPLLRAASPASVIVAFSVHEDMDTRRAALGAGASLFVAKHEGPDRLIAALRAAGPSASG